MSRDFSPRMHWHVYLKHPEIYTSNIEWIQNDKSIPFYTEEELEDRKKYIYVHVLGADIYKNLRKTLSDNEFSKLNALLGKLTEADVKSGDLTGFPEGIVNWYVNRSDSYYHEENDEEFLEYIGTKKGRDELTFLNI